MDEHENHTDLHKYPGVYQQWLIGVYVGQWVTRSIKALKLNRRNPISMHYLRWLWYLFLITAIVLFLSLLLFLYKNWYSTMSA